MENSTIEHEIRTARDAADARDWLGYAVLSLCDEKMIDSDRAYQMLAGYRAAYLERWSK